MVMPVGNSVFLTQTYTQIHSKHRQRQEKEKKKENKLLLLLFFFVVLFGFYKNQYTGTMTREWRERETNKTRRDRKKKHGTIFVVVVVSFFF